MVSGQRIFPPSTIEDAMRRGFTLVELLVVISIVALLSTLMLGALYTAQDAAKTQKTRSTIAKLNTLIMERYESYKTRRVPITIPRGTSRAVASRAKLIGLRDLMRLEMPERFTDIDDLPIATLAPGISGVSIPSVTRAYQRRINAAYALKPPGNPNLDPTKFAYKNQGAECLYLIIKYGLGDEDSALDQFQQSEIDDTDGNGLLEFVDAWKRPINFLRWAPGFESELQGQMGVVDSSAGNRSLVAQEGISEKNGAYNGRFLTFVIASNPSLAGTTVRIDANGYAGITRTFQFVTDLAASASGGDRFIITRTPPEQDPFDPFRVYPGTSILVPLIYSSGPDGIYDILAVRDLDDPSPVLRYSTESANPFNDFSSPVGSPMDKNSDQPGLPDGDDNWHDNIHNHLIGTR